MRVVPKVALLNILCEISHWYIFLLYHASLWYHLSTCNALLVQSRSDISRKCSIGLFCTNEKSIIIHITDYLVIFWPNLSWKWGFHFAPFFHFISFFVKFFRFTVNILVIKKQLVFLNAITLIICNSKYLATCLG